MRHATPVGTAMFWFRCSARLRAVKDTTPQQIEPSRTSGSREYSPFSSEWQPVFAGEFDVVLSRDGSASALIGGGLIGLGGWLYLRGRGTRDA